MIVLDTNVISELDRPRPDQYLVDWFTRTELSDLYLCAPVIAEIAFGGYRVLFRDNSERYLKALHLRVNVTFVGRILDFSTEAALKHGEIRSKLELSGDQVSLVDTQIAAICLVTGAALATRNTKDFQGLGIVLINPFEG